MPNHMKYDGGQKVFSDSADLPSYESAARAVRLERNSRLDRSDWTQKADVPLSAIKKTQWAVYRGALRDIPEQEGFPFAVDWPVKPE